MSANYSTRLASESSQVTLGEPMEAAPTGDLAPEPAPCEECPHAERCGSQGLACEQFAMFAKFGGLERWKVAPRQPSAAIFRKLFL